MSDLLNKASLVMIPSGYKEDIVYSAIPTDGSGDLSFTRASNGTRINSAGLVEDCPWNLLKYSEDFPNAEWNKSNVTITSNVVTAPNGTTTADKWVATAINGNHFISQNIGNQTGVFTFSVYAKAAEYGFLRLQDVNAGKYNIVYNLSAGTTSGTGASIEDAGNGWYKCIITFTATGTNSAYGIIGIPTSGTSLTFLGDGTSGVYLWGAQLNIGSTAKPYFPTTDRLNVPRLTYQNGGGGCPSLLLEKQSTNLLTYSEQFDNAIWGKEGVSISANSTTSPNGTQSADKIIGGTTPGNQITYQITSISLGQSYAISAYFKKGEYKNAFLRAGGQSANPYVIYDLDTQSVVSTSGASSTKIESVGNGWYRITLTSSSATTTVIAPNVAFAPNSGYTISATNTLQYTGDNTSGGFAWGAQLELGLYPTSYIPTTSASATRVADACSKTGISSLIGQTEGTLFLDCEILTTATQDLLSIRPGGTSALVIGTASNLILGYVIEGATVISMSFPNYAINTRYKIALAYKNGNCALYVNGTQAATSTTAFTFSTALSTLYLGESQYFGKASYKNNEIVLFKTRLTNDELISLTTL